MFYIIVSKESEHSNTPWACLMNQQIDNSLKKELKKYVSQGITNIRNNYYWRSMFEIIMKKYLHPLALFFQPRKSFIIMYWNISTRQKLVKLIKLHWIRKSICGKKILTESSIIVHTLRNTYSPACFAISLKLKYHFWNNM